MTRAAALALAAALLFQAGEAPPAAEAPSLDDRLRRVRARREALERELGRLRGQERSLLGEVERLEVEVRLRSEQLREAQLALQRTNQQLDETGRRMRELEASLRQARPVLAARARALYKLGDLSYLRLLLSVDRPRDFFSGYRFVVALARRDKERLARFRADLAALAATRAELEKRTGEALALRAGLDRARRNLDADRQRKTQLLTDMVERKETSAAYLQELEDAEAKLGQLLQGLGEGEVSVPMGAFKGELPWPVSGRVRGAFGRRKHPRFDTYTLHNGIDIEAALESPVAAVHEGTVAFADRFRGYGLLVILDHGGRHHSLYAHLQEATVQPGQRVAGGQVVGTVGASGLEGAGLYFELRTQGRPEDPVDWLRRR